MSAGCALCPVCRGVGTEAWGGRGTGPRPAAIPALPAAPGSSGVVDRLGPGAFSQQVSGLWSRSSHGRAQPRAQLWLVPPASVLDTGSCLGRLGTSVWLWPRVSLTSPVEEGRRGPLLVADGRWQCGRCVTAPRDPVVAQDSCSGGFWADLEGGRGARSDPGLPGCPVGAAGPVVAPWWAGRGRTGSGQCAQAT